jgi:UDP-N-acetyl-2-amino-2-deoxyglucuronate dehydrogenase
MKKFTMIGAAGYIAPRHMQAIRDTGNILVAALDPNDSVGIIDSYFPEAHFFTEFERFDRHVDKMRRAGHGVDYVAITSPNYLHDSHMRFAMRSGADAICEKPLVLNVSDLDDLAQVEADTNKRVYSILQLRLHPAIISMRKKIAGAPPGKVFDVDLTYITSRGPWYHLSWKGSKHKSGGIATNIGVHFYDMLHFLFGANTANLVHHRSGDTAAGYLEFDRARVRWMLSINRNNLPPQTPPLQTTYRSITIDGEEIEFSGGFNDLHTLSYQQILTGQGFGLAEVRPAVTMAEHIRNAPLQPGQGATHPALARLAT